MTATDLTRLVEALDTWAAPASPHLPDTEEAMTEPTGPDPTLNSELQVAPVRCEGCGWAPTTAGLDFDGMIPSHRIRDTADVRCVGSRRPPVTEVRP